MRFGSSLVGYIGRMLMNNAYQSTLYYALFGTLYWAHAHEVYWLACGSARHGRVLCVRRLLAASGDPLARTRCKTHAPGPGASWTAPGPGPDAPARESIESIGVVDAVKLAVLYQIQVQTHPPCAAPHTPSPQAPRTHARA
jgi:hypothetical protein